MTKLVASFEYSGLPDYWGGDGRRWDDDAGCVFAYYDRGTTLRDLIESAVDDFNSGGDCDSFPPEITDKDVRAALLDCLNDRGRADYECGAIADCAAEYAADNPLVCRECGECVGNAHSADCAFLAEWAENGDIDDNYECDVIVEEADCAEDDWLNDSPYVVFLLEIVEDDD